MTPWYRFFDWFRGDRGGETAIRSIRSGYDIPVKSTDLVGSPPILDMSTDPPIGFSI